MEFRHDVNLQVSLTLWVLAAHLVAVLNLYYRGGLLDRVAMMVTLAAIPLKPAPIATEISDFASRVLAARKDLGLSQKAMSEQSGIPISTLKNYELGHSSPSAENLRKMHSAGINPMWILLGHRPVLNRNRCAAAKAASKQGSVNKKGKSTTRAGISKPLKDGTCGQHPSHDLVAAAPKKDIKHG